VPSEFDLPLDGAFASSLNLSFSDHVHCLVPAYCPPRRVETGKPQSGINSLFDEPIAPLDEVVEASALSEFRGHWEKAGSRPAFCRSTRY